MKKGLMILAAAAMTLAPMTASAGVRFGVVVPGPVFYTPGWYARIGALTGVPDLTTLSRTPVT